MLNIPKMSTGMNPLTPNSFKTPPHQFNQNIKHHCSTNQSSASMGASPAPKFFQYEYPTQLYHKELAVHQQALNEYDEEIYQVMVDMLEANKPNLDLYKQQPYLTFSIRLKLIDFLLKMSIRLKILPFVFFKAVKIFDRYCSKRIVLLDQSQLIITTCLWIAAKMQGGNNHFVNLSNLDKLTSIKTINDLGYGSGGKYLGPTERFRLPKLHELVKLCGAKCKYDQGMFKQMELHVLTTLDWSLNDPSIEEFIVGSDEFSIVPDHTAGHGGSLNVSEMFKIKEFLSYVALYSFELIDTNLIDLGKVVVDLINETFKLGGDHANFQKVLVLDDDMHSEMDAAKYKFIKKNVIKAVLNSSDFILKLFNSKGCQYLYQQLHATYKSPYGASPSICTPGTPSITLSMTPRKRMSPTQSTSPYSAISHNSFTSFSSNKKASPTSSYTHPGHPMSTPPASRAIPAPHQLSSSTYKSFNSPITAMPTSNPPQVPSKNIYKPVFFAQSPGSYSCARTLYKLPSITTQHQHNASQASLNSSASSKADSHEDGGVADIFEFDYSRKGGISTPLSENESPIYSMAKQ